MKTPIRTLLAVALAGGVAMISPAFAQHEHEAAGHSHTSAETHGGKATMTKDFHFETVFHRDEVLVYVYDGKQGSLDARRLAGAIEIQFRDKSREPLQASLDYVAGDSGQMGYLRAALDLNGIDDGAAKATINLHGLGGESEKDVSYKATFQLSMAPAADHDDGDDHHGNDKKKRANSGHSHG